MTEFGVRTGNSTVAFLHALEENKTATLRSYDLNDNYEVKKAFEKHTSVDWSFTLCSTIQIPAIDQTDFLFIDTLHTYAQLTQELRIHANQVLKYIAFHDTNTFGDQGEGGGLGIRNAINDWLIAHCEWRAIYTTEKNNGLIVIERSFDFDETRN